MVRPVEVRLDVPNRALLDTLVTASLPLRLRPGPIAHTSHRDLYYDTPDGELKRRGVICRLRIASDDRRFLTLRLRPPGMPADRPTERIEAEVGETAPDRILAGASAPARRLQAVVDPARLVPRVELAVDRRRRRARTGFALLPQFELAYDAVTARVEGSAVDYHEVVVRRLRTSRLPIDRVAQALSDGHGLRPTLTDPLERALQLLETLESAELARAVQEHREVTVVAVEGGRVALGRGQDDLRLPFQRGSGEDACRSVMRDAFSSAEGQVVLLGVVPASGTRPALEVWLARRLRRDVGRAMGGALQWFAPGEIVARAGSPVLRDPKTLAALTLASRSELLPEWSAMARDDEAGYGGEFATDEHVVSSRRTLTELRVPVLSEEARDAARAAPEQFINPELSWLEFNARVLALAEDPGVPLLARVRFLSIFSTNLDEFVMVKVAALKQAVAAGVSDPSPDGLTPAEQLDAIAIRLHGLVERQYRCFESLRERDLPAQGIRIRAWEALDPAERALLATYFDEQVFPALTPRAITRAPGHPFPLIDELTLSLAVMVRDDRSGRLHFAQLKVPDGLPRFVRLADSRDFVPLEAVIRAHAGALYPGRRVEEVHPFRVVRTGDIDLDEPATASFAQAIEEELRRRPVAPIVRLEVERSMPRELLGMLRRELRFEEAEQAGGLGEIDIAEVAGMVDLGALGEIAALDVPALHYPPFTARDPFPDDRPVFALVDARDRLVHHPYDAFDATFQRFIVEAADDPTVMAIKLTLYRPGGPSVMADALKRAAAAGKDVSVFVELKARFDEERNIYWAKQLERAGIHVVTGLVKYKTHAKVALVVRREGGKLRRYAQVSTGNYNASSARQYTDFGLFTADPQITADVHLLFNELTGSSDVPRAEFQRLLVAPTNMRRRFLELIERESDHARAGRSGRIRAKMNALQDRDVIAALYRGSQAGVDIELIVRGFCTLRPGVPGLSERIRVVSLLGRFLEHGRIYCFENAGAAEYYIGSADWRPRNLKRRVEVVTPVLDPAARERLELVLQTELDDPFAWELRADGTYGRAPLPTGVELKSAQEVFVELTAIPTSS